MCTALTTSHRLFGYDQGVMGGLLTLPSFLSTFPEIDVNSGTTQSQRDHISTIQGIAVASYNVGEFALDNLNFLGTEQQLTRS